MIRWLANINDKESVLAPKNEIENQDVIYFDEESYEDEKFY